MLAKISKEERLPSYEELKTYDREQLLDLQNRVRDSLVEIKGQISAAKAKVITEGEFSDSVWFSKVKKALAVFQRYDQVTQQLLGKRRRAKTLPVYFMDAAHRILPEKDFLKIKEAAFCVMNEELNGRNKGVG